MSVRRASEIAAILSEEGLSLLAVKMGLKQAAQAVNGSWTASDADDPKALPERLRRVLERLGPMFVKFGQVLSTRYDLLPDEYCKEFAKLRATVPPFDVDTAVAIVEQELGKPLAEVFAQFDRKPLAAASIAQVHRATLLSGESVVVKIQRPNALETVTGDIELLLSLSQNLDRLVPAYRAAQFHQTAEEFAQFSLRELNFLVEAETTAKFAANFAGNEWVDIPHAYLDLCTKRILVLQFIEGVPLDCIHGPEDLAKHGIDMAAVFKSLVHAVMDQAFVHGLIHADMHPGNVFVLPEGRIALIDFGMWGEVERKVQSAILRSLYHRSERRFEDAADALMEITKPIPGRGDAAACRQDFIAIDKRLSSSTVKEYSVGHSFQEQMRAGIKHGFTVPSALVILGRAIITVEGIAINHLPDARLDVEMGPIIRAIVMRRLNVGASLKETLAMAPEALEVVEMLPATYRQILRLQRSFAEASSLRAFLESHGLIQGLRQGRDAGASGRAAVTAVTAVVWLVGAALAIASTLAPGQGDVVLHLGEAVLAFGMLLTLKLVFLPTRQ